MPSASRCSISIISPAPSILASGLRRDFRVPQTGTSFPVLDISNLEITSGERVAVLGPSGSGKTTLLNIIAALLRPSHGEITVNGVALHNLSEQRLDAFRAANVGYVFQAFRLLPAFTALENVMLAMEFSDKVPRSERPTHAREVLQQLGLGKRLTHRPPELSVGEQQRVALARALANNPAIILADEPTANVDPPTRQVILDLLLEHTGAAGRTLVVATHDPGLLPAFDRVVTLNNGALSSDGVH